MHDTNLSKELIELLRDEVVKTKYEKSFTVDELSDWVEQNGAREISYNSASQGGQLSRCFFNLHFDGLSFDGPSRVATLHDLLGNRMKLIGVVGAKLHEDPNTCTTLTIKCREDPLLGVQDNYTFTI